MTTMRRSRTPIMLYVTARCWYILYNSLVRKICGGIFTQIASGEGKYLRTGGPSS